MSKFERYNGKIHNIEPTLLDRTVAEQIDNYQMKIYELIKHTYPEMIGYKAACYETLTNEGELDIKTQFYMTRPENPRRLEK